MSKYTTELRFICEELSGLGNSVGYSDVNEVIEKARPKIFNFEYPLFDANYKGVLETKIIKHFYTREIGCETVGLWRLWLDTRLNEIMPYYNKMYEVANIDFNPFYDTDITTTRTISKDGGSTDNGNTVSTTSETGGVTTKNSGSENGSKSVDTTTDESENVVKSVGDKTSDSYTKNVGNNGTETRNSSTTGNKWEYFSDTPQGGITGIENKNYLTSAKNITDSQTDSSTTTTEDTETDTYTGETDRSINESIDTSKSASGTERGTTENTTTFNSDVNSTKTNNGNVTTSNENVFNSTEEYIDHVVGKRGSVSYSKLIMEFREALVNVDLLIMQDLEDLFFQLW